MGEQTDQQSVEEKPSEEPKKPEGIKSFLKFWTTLPGILTAVATLIVAVTGLIAALANAGILSPMATEPPTPTFTATLTQSSTPTSIPSITPTPTIKPSNTPTPSEIPTFTPTSTNTTIPIPSVTPRPDARIDLCVRRLDDNATVREGPDTSFPSKGRLSPDTCLTFDLRLLDNSWVQIAQDQRDENLQLYALGWVKSELLSEAEEIVNLNYFPEDAERGLYCIDTGAGMNIRMCADSSCPLIKTLLYQECLVFDGRLEDSLWIRIAQDQEDQQYAELANRWVSTDRSSLILSEFQFFYKKPDMRPYFELLPIVTPPPTPTG